MTKPDPCLLIRLLAGERVFDRDTDRKILQAANEVSGRALFELFRRCDAGSPGWSREFAAGLMGLSTGDPAALIGFDDGRWQGLEEAGDERPEEDRRVTSVDCYLRLEFTNAEACYYQFHLFPRLDEPFLCGVSRKRAGESQYLRVELARPEDLQMFIQNLRRNPHLRHVHDSSEEEFRAAPSHAV
jgi:hypothetical protein